MTYEHHFSTLAKGTRARFFQGSMANPSYEFTAFFPSVEEKVVFAEQKGYRQLNETDYIRAKTHT